MLDHIDVWAWVVGWLQENWPALYAGLLAVVIAGLRVVYGGGSLRRMAIEAPLCGTLALSASHGLSLIGMPLDTAPFFGGVIGLLGVEGIREAARRFVLHKGKDEQQR
ncbi:phage holin, lambda family [Pseudomonas guariconensis]|uniref:phage holin, lambda family n=1 Tax=Pseudomonas guariconensis TaxID=1288410 RepID=UPI0018A93008|nr:phage holin, lambda family [Pseudomonas guariconensis]MBF8723109.1 phage holin, lambda family [Pseudomonas guariconensis]MBF8793390.1 phage holin, lambda family [Pseudomonas monteilii]